MVVHTVRSRMNQESSDPVPKQWEKPSLFFCQLVEDFQSHGVRVYGDQRFWWTCQSLPDQVFHLFLWLSLISVSKAFKSTLTFLMYTGIVWWHVNFNLQSKYICLINLPFQLCFKDSANGVIGHKKTCLGEWLSLPFLLNCFHVSVVTSPNWSMIKCTFMDLLISQGTQG